ncbi:hypothetical protein GCM10027598_36550 [Amycolatopsis oliviviridis]|uniref:Secreted protein n=1 Tax=Amycolatopsis oliviviridis TaxID=1471590 RepID=A0ABQ3LHJ4_9PSEU|nr:hypothetical protein [Amycolatopsis oliviviridis]GHH13038.1 hypothetical protein GCM10017790_25280 [Amycolatopsis oliviviridis]
MKRLLAAALTSLALFGAAACTDEKPASSSAPGSTPGSTPGELSDVQRTLDSIEQDMADDPAP